MNGIGARRYGATVVNELVRIRKQLKADGWDYGPKSIHHEASILDSFPGGAVPSVATIARLLASVGQVDAAPRKRPRSSYVPFVRATAMALWQLDAFEYRLASGETATVYQLLDDATRYDVGTWAYARKENSSDAKDVLERAINEYGAPMELLSDNSHAFNQLRRGSIGAVEVFLASRGTMPISGLPGRPTTQGKTERSHQTLIRYLNADRPTTVGQLQRRILKYREHYNQRRPHQALRQATPKEAWDLLEHTPATEPIPLVALEAKASQYAQARRLRDTNLERSSLTISKTGEPLNANPTLQAPDQLLVEVKLANRKIYYHGYFISLPSSLAGRLYYRSITDAEFLLADPDTGEIVFSFPLPMVALHVRGRYVASYSIRGVQLSHPNEHWASKHADFKTQFEQRQEQTPRVFECS